MLDCIQVFGMLRAPGVEGRGGAESGEIEWQVEQVLTPLSKIFSVILFNRKRERRYLC